MTLKKNNSPEFYDTASLDSHLSRLREMFRFRYLLQNLIVRDLKVRYKNSLLGVLWSLLNPLLMMAVYTLLFTKLRPTSQSIKAFHVFILVALVPWQFFASALIGGTQAITNNSTIVKKVYFPRILLPLSVILSNLVNFLIAFGVLVVIILISRLPLTIHIWWVIPLLLTEMLFLLGITLILGAIHVFYRDISMILDVGMLAWFFLTPIFYPFEELGTQAVIWGISFNPARVMRWVNPMASIVDGFRTVLWGNVNNQVPAGMDILALGRTFATALILFLIGYSLFNRMEHLFGEKL
jgi:lipopolysaccharide transport system permease protein